MRRSCRGSPAGRLCATVNEIGEKEERGKYRFTEADHGCATGTSASENNEEDDKE